MTLPLDTTQVSHDFLREGAHIQKEKNSFPFIKRHSLHREKTSSMYLFWHFRHSLKHLLSKSRFLNINNKGPLYIFWRHPLNGHFFQFKGKNSFLFEYERPSLGKPFFAYCDICWKSAKMGHFEIRNTQVRGWLSDFLPIIRFSSWL